LSEGQKHIGDSLFKSELRCTANDRASRDVDGFMPGMQCSPLKNSVSAGRRTVLGAGAPQDQKFRRKYHVGSAALGHQNP
jgi:hypothetical protein